MDDPNIVYSHSRIQAAVEKLARKVRAWVSLEMSAELHLVSVLEGARPFTRDLVSHLGKVDPALRLKIHEVRVRGTLGTQLLEQRELDWGGWDPAVVRGKRVLVVDDLADSGKTLQILKGDLLSQGAGEIKTAVLIRKWGSQSLPVDFCGLDLNLDPESLAQKGLRDYWLYGYGMDLDGNQRDLDHVGWVGIEA